MKGVRFFNSRVASHHFRSLSVFQNPSTLTISLSQHLPFLDRASDPTFFPLFNRLTQTAGISSDDYTYGIMIMIKYCSRTNRLNLAFSFLGRLLKEGHRAEAVIFNPILNDLCFQNRIGEANHCDRQNA